jgi:predicted DNA-binding protein
VLAGSHGEEAVEQVLRGQVDIESAAKGKGGQGKGVQPGTGFVSPDGWQNYGKTRDNGVTMASDSNITLPAELLAQVQALAAKEGKTVDELMVEAVKRDIARRMIANLKREGKPSGMAEDGEIQAAVDAVHEYRGR